MASSSLTARVGLCLLNLVVAAELSWVLSEAVHERSDDSSGGSKAGMAVFILATAIALVLGLFFAGVSLRPPSRQQVTAMTADAVYFFVSGVLVLLSTLLYSWTSVLISFMAVIPALVGLGVASSRRFSIRKAVALQNGAPRRSSESTFVVYCIPDQTS